MREVMTVPLTVSNDIERIPMRICTPQAIPIGVSSEIRVYGAEDYRGEYTITPTTTAQVLAVNDKRMTADLIINPIPSNYGLITWDGNTLLVS